MRTIRLLAVVLLGCLLVGCGSGKLKARGRLTKSGQPFVPGQKEIVHIAFFPAGEQSDSSAKAYVVHFNRDDGTFRVTGTDGKGLPPGKYRVTVSLMKDHKDELKGAFNAKNSPFIFDVSSSSEEIALDLATPSEAPSATKAAKAAKKSRS